MIDVEKPSAQDDRQRRRPLRLLVVMPSWLGDAVMATPALRLLRDGLAGAYVGGLVRPGLDELLDGAGLFDEVHVGVGGGVMGPKRLAAKVRGRGYDTALLLTNSFSTALAARLAFIPRRVGYDRDGRGLLLTERVKPERREGGGFACVSAVEAYVRLARGVAGEAGTGGRADAQARLELAVTGAQERAAEEVLARAGVSPGEPYAVITPGANDAAKRWPAERFAEVAAHLARTRGWRVLVSGSPAEAGLCEEVCSRAAGAASTGRPPPFPLPRGGGVTIGSLKGVVRGARLMVTNDTGPRHIALAFGVPTVAVFGPTDPRWTTPPACHSGRSVEVVADPGLPEDQVADDHPERCRIDRIEVGRVIEATDRVLAGRVG